MFDKFLTTVQEIFSPFEFYTIESDSLYYKIFIHFKDNFKLSEKLKVFIDETSQKILITNKFYKKYFYVNFSKYSSNSVKAIFENNILSIIFESKKENKLLEVPIEYR